jgi:hypothetical protein
LNNLWNMMKPQNKIGYLKLKRKSDLETAVQRARSNLRFRPPSEGRLRSRPNTFSLPYDSLVYCQFLSGDAESEQTHCIFIKIYFLISPPRCQVSDFGSITGIKLVDR